MNVIPFFLCNERAEFINSIPSELAGRGRSASRLAEAASIRSETP